MKDRVKNIIRKFVDINLPKRTNKFFDERRSRFGRDVNGSVDGVMIRYERYGPFHRRDDIGRVAREKKI